MTVILLTLFKSYLMNDEGVNIKCVFDKKTNMNNDMVLKYTWILLLGCLLIFDVFCILNSDFFQLKSMDVKIKNENLASISLFKNSYHRVTKPLILSEEGIGSFNNFENYILLIKQNRGCKNQSSVSYQISGKSYNINLVFNKNQNENEVKTHSNFFAVWIINENKHKFYGINILIILFAFIKYNWR